MNSKNVYVIDVGSIVRDLLHHWLLLIIAGVSGALILGAAVKLAFVPQYTCTTSFAVNVTGKGNFISKFNNVTTTDVLLENFEAIAGSDVLKKRVCTDLDLEKLNAEVKLDAVENTNLIVLTITDKNPMNCYQIANSVMRLTEDLLEEISSDVSVRVIKSPAFPLYSDNQPETRKMMVLGAGAAVLLMAAMIGYLSMKRDTIKTESDFTSKIDGKLLGTIRHEKKKGNSKKYSLLINNASVSFGYVESIRMLATKIRKLMHEKKAQVLLITSVAENEGKSTVAANIALSLAQEGKKVCLVDLDARNPAQHKLWEITDENKEKDFLAAISQKKKLVPIRLNKGNTLHGFFPFESYGRSKIADMMGTISILIDKLRKHYDYIILDTAPVGIVSDTSEIAANCADAGILVIAQDVIEAVEINDAIDHLKLLELQLLGCIYNNVRGFTNTGKYGYGYGYGSKDRYGKYKGYGYGAYGKYAVNADLPEAANDNGLASVVFEPDSISAQHESEDSQET